MTVSGRGLQVTEKCEALLREWHREQIRGVMPSLLATWLPVIGVELREWRIKKMKTRWGSCNIRSRRIWLNLELAKLPISCLEYVVVHELVHLLERYHNRRFHLLMDGFMPDWRDRKELLNSWQPCISL